MIWGPVVDVSYLEYVGYWIMGADNPIYWLLFALWIVLEIGYVGVFTLGYFLVKVNQTENIYKRFIVALASVIISILSVIIGFIGVLVLFRGGGYFMPVIVLAAAVVSFPAILVCIVTIIQFC